MTTPPLPMWQTLRLAVASLLEHRDLAMRIVLPWLAVLMPLAAYGAWLQANFLLGVVATGPGSAPSRLHPSPYFVWAQLLIMAVGGSCMAVAWHRLLILGERPALGGRNVLDGRVWSYIGHGLLITFVPMLAVLLALLVVGSIPGSFTAAGTRSHLTFLVLAAAYVACIAVMMRLMLVLPARAVGNTALKLDDVWIATRGSGLRIFGGLVISTLPWAMAMHALAWVSGAVPRPRFGPPGTRPVLDVDPQRFAAFNAISIAVYTVLILVFVGFLSHAYRHFATAAATPPEPAPPQS